MRLTGGDGGDVNCGDCGDADCTSTETVNIYIYIIH
jgi:hypothetical protein